MNSLLSPLIFLLFQCIYSAQINSSISQSEFSAFLNCELKCQSATKEQCDLECYNSFIKCMEANLYSSKGMLEQLNLSTNECKSKNQYLALEQDCILNCFKTKPSQTERPQLQTFTSKAIYCKGLCQFPSLAECDKSCLNQVNICFMKYSNTTFSRLDQSRYQILNCQSINKKYTDFLLCFTNCQYQRTDTLQDYQKFSDQHKVNYCGQKQCIHPSQSECNQACRNEVYDCMDKNNFSTKSVPEQQGLLIGQCKSTNAIYQKYQICTNQCFNTYNQALINEQNQQKCALQCKEPTLLECDSKCSSEFKECSDSNILQGDSIQIQYTKLINKCKSVNVYKYMQLLCQNNCFNGVNNNLLDLQKQTDCESKCPLPSNEECDWKCTSKVLDCLVANGGDQLSIREQQEIQTNVCKSSNVSLQKRQECVKNCFNLLVLEDQEKNSGSFEELIKIICLWIFILFVF